MSMALVEMQLRHVSTLQGSVVVVVGLLRLAKYHTAGEQGWTCHKQHLC